MVEAAVVSSPDPIRGEVNKLSKLIYLSSFGHIRANKAQLPRDLSIQRFVFLFKIKTK